MKNVFVFINCQKTVMKPFWEKSEWFSDTKKFCGPITLQKNIQNVVKYRHYTYIVKISQKAQVYL